METVIAVSFDDPNRLYDAVTKLKELDQQGQVAMYEGRVVERDLNGRLVVKDSVQGGDDDRGVATVSGGLIGLLIGVLAGPVGMLLGGSIGLMTGAVIDMDVDDRDDSVLSAFTRQVQPGQTALFAHLDEQSYEVVDNAMRGMGGNVLRRPALDVESELAAAQEARDVAENEAREKLRKEHREQKKEEIDSKLDALRAKFRKPEKTRAAS
ncbi:MAG TPA: DUF1269 domain-containing protein [Thermoleophilaceae bacterium]